MMQSNGRRFYRVCGRSVIHSDIMDCLYHNEARTETVTLFAQPAKAGRFTCEFRGYVSFPLKAKIEILELASFKEPFCDSVFAESFSLKVVSVQNWNNNYSYHSVVTPPGGGQQYLVSNRNEAYQSYQFFDQRCVMNDGSTRTFYPTLNFIANGSAEDNSVPIMKQWFDTVYYPSVPLAYPAEGMTYDDVLALGWDEMLNQFTRWVKP